MYRATLTIKPKQVDDSTTGYTVFKGGFYDMPEAGKEFTFYWVTEGKGKESHTYSMSTKVNHVTMVAGGFILATPEAICELKIGERRAKPRRRR